MKLKNKVRGLRSRMLRGHAGDGGGIKGDGGGIKGKSGLFPVWYCRGAHVV